MSTFSRIALTIAILALGGTTVGADGLSGSVSPQLGGGIGGFDGGISIAPVPSAAPSSCSGTIDLSTGCKLPMIGG